MLLAARSRSRFFSGLLGYSGKLAWLRQAWAYRGEIGGKSSVSRYTRCISLGIAPIAKRVVLLDSPGRWLRNTRGSDRFGYLSSLLGYPDKLAWLRQAWTWAILAYFDLFGHVCGVMTAVTSPSKLVWLVGVMCMFVRAIRVLFVPKMLYLSRG